MEKATIDGQDTTMVYDADGERLIRRDPGGKATLYLGSMEIEVNGDTITGKRYYTTPDGATVAMRTGGDGVTWLMSGLHGSAQLAVDDTTGKVSRERYLPYGQRRGDDDLPFTDHGFLGKIEDESTGLDYLSARYYDPTIGKFISTDPLLVLGDPQWTNPYSYASDNPIGLSDPTGLIHLDYAYGQNGGVKGWQEDQDAAKHHRKIKRHKAWAPAARGREYGYCDAKCKKDVKNHTLDKKIAKAKAEEKKREQARALAKDKEGIQPAGILGEGEDVDAAIAFLALGLATDGAGDALLGEAAAGAEMAEAEAIGGSTAKAVSKARPCNSFVPGTKVLMADGGYKPIEQVRIGDSVLAADPISGRTEDKVVVSLISGEGDKDLVEITLDTDGAKGNETARVIATDEHPFWVADLRKWVDAKDLSAGMWLRTSAGTYVQVAAIEKRTAPHQRAHNLTIADLHTYYVAAGDQAVLVHNTDGCSDPLQDYANLLRPGATKRGPHVAAEYTSPSGEKYYGYNGHGMSPQPGGALEQALQASGHHGGCAEVMCLIQAETAEGPAGITGGTMRAVRVRGLKSQGTAHGTPIDPCPNACTPLLGLLGIYY